MKKTTKICSVIITLAMLVSLIAGCGGKSAETTTQAASGETTTQAASGETTTQAASGETTTQATGESVVRDVINVGIEADVTTWAPWDSGSSGRNDALFEIYQGLFDFDALNGDFIPILLESYEITDDNLSIVCKLREGIYDSEGNDIKAADVKYSLDCASQIATDLQDIVMDIQDDYNFTFTFVDDDGSQRETEVGELKRFCFFIVAEETEGMDLAAKPVGTGPYKLDSQTSGYMFTFVKNDNYWAAGKELGARFAQNVNTINWYVIAESAQRTNALETGTIDICAYISNEDIAKFEGNGYTKYQYPHNLSMIMWCNCDSASPCNDVNLRLAINYAVSGEAVLASVYNGAGDVMYDQCPNWQVNYNTAWESEDNYYHFDIDKAKEYLSKSGYKGETLTIICNTNSSCVNTAQIVENFLGQIGVSCEVASYESSVYSEYIKEPGNWDIMVNTRPASSGFIANGWESDMASYRQPWGGTINFAMDDTFQEMLSEVLKVTATQEQYDELHDYMIENAYSKGLVNYYQTIIIPDYISDVVLSYRKTILPGSCTDPE